MTWHLNQVPKIAHFYWDSPSGMSFLRAMTIVSFHKFNPDWKIKIHKSTHRHDDLVTWKSREHRIKTVDSDNYDLLKGIPIEWVEWDFEDIGFSNSVSEVHKSDYLRWILLSTEGGLWSDFDILYRAPLDRLDINTPVFNKVSAFTCQYSNGQHAIGFLFGSKYENTFWQHVTDISKESYDPNGYQSLGSSILNNIEQPWFDQYTHKIPAASVYPLMIQRPQTFWQETHNINHAIGIHWYAGHRDSIHWDNKLDRNNYTKYNNTITKTLREIE